MKTRTIVTTTFVVSAWALSILCGSEDIIAQCSSGPQDYKAAPFIRTAKALQEEGQQSATVKLRGWSASGKDFQVIVLCRMLFEARSGEAFRRPALGEPNLVNDAKVSEFPLEPIVLFEGVPILITKSYNLRGVPESSREYLEYCVNECSWRKLRYPVYSEEALSKRVARWISQYQGEDQLSLEARKFITSQAEQAVSPKSDRAGG